MNSGLLNKECNNFVSHALEILGCTVFSLFYRGEKKRRNSKFCNFRNHNIIIQTSLIKYYKIFCIPESFNTNILVGGEEILTLFEFVIINRFIMTNSNNVKIPSPHNTNF